METGIILVLYKHGVVLAVGSAFIGTRDCPTDQKEAEIKVAGANLIDDYFSRVKCSATIQVLDVQDKFKVLKETLKSPGMKLIKMDLDPNQLGVAKNNICQVVL